MHGTLPPARDAVADRRADERACAAAIRAGSKSFHAASLLLPPHVRRSALALYAFCRLSDDMVDGGDFGPAVEGATRRLSARLDRIYSGTPADHPADRSFARIVERHAIPRELPDALIEGFEWDEAGRRYDTIGELHEYGTRVAAAVGAMMTLIMGQRDPVVLARACDLGLAMQLTNICRDVGEDAAEGRLYLPRQWMHEAGLDPDAFLAAPLHDERIAGVIERVLGEATRLYARASTGVGALPPGCRAAIQAALSIYRDIGREIAMAGHDSVTRRARTTKARKVALATAAHRARLMRPRLDVSPAMPQVRHLIDAVVRSGPPSAQANVSGMGRFVELLDSMDGRRGTRLPTHDWTRW